MKEALPSSVCVLFLLFEPEYWWCSETCWVRVGMAMLLFTPKCFMKFKKPEPVCMCLSFVT